MKYFEVRDGKKVAVTCPECGCRLRITGEGFARHYWGIKNERDARGHLCSLNYEVWFWRGKFKMILT